jgi:hypothetical protein
VWRTIEDQPFEVPAALDQAAFFFPGPVTQPSSVQLRFNGIPDSRYLGSASGYDQIPKYRQETVIAHGEHLSG